MADERPTYTHDCMSCVFLGSVQLKGRIIDLYHCDVNGGFGGTSIARLSSDGWDYISLDDDIIAYIEGQLALPDKGKYANRPEMVEHYKTYPVLEAYRRHRRKE